MNNSLTMAEKTNLIIAISAISLCLFIYVPLIVWYLCKFRRLSSLIVIKKRYPESVSFLCILIIFYYLIGMPFCIITRTNLFLMKGEIIMNMDLHLLFERISYITYPLFNILIHYILCLRCWHIVYDLHWVQADATSGWKYHLDPSLIETNFWLKYKKTFGNFKVTKKIIFIVYIICVIISITTFQLTLNKPNFISIAYGINSFFHLLPILIIISLWIKTPKISDNFFIRQEFKLLAIAVIINLLTYISCLIIILYINEYIGNILLFFQASGIYFIIAMIMTYWVRHRIFCQIWLFNNAVLQKEKEEEAESGNTNTDSSRHSLTKTSSSRLSNYKIDIGFLFGEYGASLIQSPSIHSNSTHSQFQSPVTPTFTHIDGLSLPTFHSIELHSNSFHGNPLKQDESAAEFTKKIKLFHVLTNKQTIELFMQHLANEFSQELLLCFLQIIQWKRAFYYAYQTINNGKTIKTDQCHHVCPIGSIMPWSSIVKKHFPLKSDNKTFKNIKDDKELLIRAKKASHDIHLKYIQVGSELEINISHPIRSALHSLCFDINSFINNTNIKIQDLFTIYDDVAGELYRLMNNSFTRFTKKPQWTKVLYTLSREPLVQPMMGK